jgi:hypothetical protein
LSSVSAKELRTILDEVMQEIDADPDDGSRLRAAAAPLRLEFTDLNLALNISRGDGGHLAWDFKKRSAAKAKLGLSMDSDFGNRLMQGRENPAIAIARGRLHTTVLDPGAAVRLFPAVKPLFVRYRELVSEKYPHLAVDAD